MRLLTLFTLLAGLAQADQITMKNGDRVTGAIIKKDNKTLTIKSTHFGTITLPWDEIQTLKSDKPLTVTLQPGNKSMEGPVSTTANSGKTQVASQTVDTKDIVTLRNADEQKAYLRMLHPKLTELWTVTGNLGFAGASGNARTHTITVPLTFVRATSNDKLTVNFNLIRSAATVNGVSAETASAIRGGWSYNRDINKRTFLSGINSYEYDHFQNLDLRAVIGGGAGAHALKSEHGFIDLTAGGDYNHEAFTTFTRTLGELYWGDNGAWKPTKKVSFTHSYRMFNSVTGPAAFRQNADIAVNLTLSKYFTWNATASDRYLTNPSPGLGRNDFLYSTGLGFKFAR